MRYTASCHCHAVQFNVDAPSTVKAVRCNCSICTLTAPLHLLLAKNKITDLRGVDNLSCYQFNQKVAQHYFCKTCGVRPFYVPRSNPNGYSVNVRCLEPAPSKIIIEEFDGKNWEDNAHVLAGRTKE